MITTAAGRRGEAPEDGGRGKIASGAGGRYLRQAHKTALGMEEFLSLGVLAMSYGLAQVSYALGFLAVFAAGLALRHVEAGPAISNPSSLSRLTPWSKEMGRYRPQQGSGVHGIGRARLQRAA